MKKLGIIILAIILIIGLGFGVKSLLDMDAPAEIQNTAEEGGLEWEIEAEYTYNETIAENIVQ